MLEIQRFVKLLKLMDEEDLSTKEEKITEVAMILGGISMDSAVTFLVIHGVDKDKIIILNNLRYNGFLCLCSLLDPSRFDEGSYHAFSEGIDKTIKFLNTFHTPAAEECLNRLKKYTE